ncbi:MAG: hypothetical protein KF784_13870 [Fimbriimonadaceae bacterium]|nr:hypothetical protein [Fimbriimonadaceae bacterium]
MSAMAQTTLDWITVRKAFFASTLAGFVVALVTSPTSIPGITSSLGNTPISQAIYHFILGLGMHVVPSAIAFALTFMIPLVSGNKTLRWAWGTLLILASFQGELRSLPWWIQEGRVAEILVNVLIFGGVLALLCWLWDRKQSPQEPVSEENGVRIARSWPVLGTAIAIGAFAAVVQSVLTFLSMRARAGGVEVGSFFWEQHWKALPGEIFAFGVMLGCLLPSRSKSVYRWLIGTVAVSMIIKALSAYPSMVDTSSHGRPGIMAGVGEWGLTVLAGLAVNVIALWLAIMLYLLVNPEEKIGEWSERWRAKRQNRKIQKAQEWLSGE